MAALPSYLNAELVRGARGAGVVIDGTADPALPDEHARHVIRLRPGATNLTTCLVATYRWVLGRGVEPHEVTFRLSPADRGPLIARLRHSGDPEPAVITAPDARDWHNDQRSKSISASDMERDGRLGLHFS